MVEVAVVVAVAAARHTCIMHSNRVGFLNCVRSALAYFGLTNSGTSPAVRSSASTYLLEGDRARRGGVSVFLFSRARARENAL